MYKTLILYRSDPFLFRLLTLPQKCSHQFVCFVFLKNELSFYLCEF